MKVRYLTVFDDLKSDYEANKKRATSGRHHLEYWNRDAANITGCGVFKIALTQWLASHYDSSVYYLDIAERKHSFSNTYNIYIEESALRVKAWPKDWGA